MTPFLYEMRAMLDWACAHTTLDFWQVAARPGRPAPDMTRINERERERREKERESLMRGRCAVSAGRARVRGV